METTIVYWCLIWIMENKMETTIVCFARSHRCRTSELACLTLLGNPYGRSLRDVCMAMIFSPFRHKVLEFLEGQDGRANV